MASGLVFLLPRFPHVALVKMLWIVSPLFRVLSHPTDACFALSDALIGQIYPQVEAQHFSAETKSRY